MSTCISILKALCDGNEKLFYEVIDEIKEQITFKVVDGVRQVNTEKTLKFAMSLECANYNDVMPRQTTHDLLREHSNNKELIDQLLGRPGSSDGGNQYV